MPTREKPVRRLIEIFARWIVPKLPDAKLTWVGDGPDHDAFQADARRRSARPVQSLA
jgi:hypothetical protein